MTPRERVLMALAHQQPDLAPGDFWAEPPTWNRLFAHVGHTDEDRLLDSHPFSPPLRMHQSLPKAFEEGGDKGSDKGFDNGQR